VAAVVMGKDDVTVWKVVAEGDEWALDVVEKLDPAIPDHGPLP
jgi:hypothetical protein